MDRNYISDNFNAIIKLNDRYQYRIPQEIENIEKAISYFNTDDPEPVIGVRLRAFRCLVPAPVELVTVFLEKRLKELREEHEKLHSKIENFLQEGSE